MQAFAHAHDLQGRRMVSGKVWLTPETSASASPMCTIIEPKTLRSLISKRASLRVTPRRCRKWNSS